MLSTYEWMLIFLLFYASISYFINKTNASRITFISLTTIHLIIVSGLRSINVGADTLVYREVFNSLKNVPLNETFSVYRKFEHGYQLLTYFFSNVFGSFNLYLFFISVFIYVVLGYIIYKFSLNPFFSYVLYIVLGLFDFNLSGLRQSLAMSIVLFSIVFLLNRKFIRFFLTILAASLFHKTALIFIVIYPLIYSPLNNLYKKLYSVILLFLLLFGYKITEILITFFQEGYMSYVSGFNITKRFLIFFGLLVISWLIKYFKVNNKNNHLFDVLVIINSVTVLLELIGGFSYLFTRLNMFNSQFIILLFPLIVDNLLSYILPQFNYTTAKNIKLFSLFFFITLIFIYYNNYLGANPHNILPYTFYWE